MHLVLKNSKFNQFRSKIEETLDDTKSHLFIHYTKDSFDLRNVFRVHRPLIKNLIVNRIK